MNFEIQEKKKKRKIISVIQKHKRIVFAIIGIIFIILVVFFIVDVFLKKTPNEEIVTDETPGITKNNNEEFLEEIEQSGLRFYDIECSYDGKNSLLSYKIINHTETSIQLNKYELFVKNKDGNVLTIIAPSIEKELKPNEEISITNEVNIDITDAYYLELNLIQ